MLKWGIMATGAIANQFAETLLQMGDEVVLTAVASRNEENAKKFAEKFHAAKWYASYEELCKDNEVNVIYIATPNSMHYENCVQCLNHGKHVLCEKPLTLNAKDARSLYQIAKEKKLFIMEAFWIKHLPLHKKMLEIVARGEIGEVKHIRADYGFMTSKSKKRKFELSLGGGAIMDVGIYNIGFVWMVMKEKPKSFESKVTMNEYGTDEFSTVIFQFPGDKTATITTCIGMEIPTESVIYGTKGSIHFPNYHRAEKMYIKQYGGKSYEIDMPFEINGFEYQIRETNRCILEGRLESEVLTNRDSLEVLNIMDRIRSSWGLKFSVDE
ncbi:putative dehydrogenase [Lachnotalea glycerini]|uniref:Gfo/Idh/MocA family oxidoreductase n=1 Tax=Lachnotalea glycerini TaxID=1763509 RepID=A0A255ICX5_9FIRM|nr:Gfo/Idh/MocA family oxidoreductase [Lachnotalea glycerini]PXV85299.1 putative dehydrogenase [Lachnotalea glycerini]RDY28626.1 gfo/Idh/MocA family oxidoreductase [Lachnotalea glycerini]